MIPDRLNITGCAETQFYWENPHNGAAANAGVNWTGCNPPPVDQWTIGCIGGPEGVVGCIGGPDTYMWQYRPARGQWQHPGAAGAAGAAQHGYYQVIPFEPIWESHIYLQVPRGVDSRTEVHRDRRVNMRIHSVTLAQQNWMPLWVRLPRYFEITTVITRAQGYLIKTEPMEPINTRGETS